MGDVLKKDHVHAGILFRAGGMLPPLDEATRIWLAEQGVIDLNGVHARPTAAVHLDAAPPRISRGCSGCGW